MHEICLALGSNLGDRLANLQSAVDKLAPYVHFAAASPVFETDPVYATDQPQFLNAAIRGTTDLDPQALLFTAKSIEREIGRIPTYRNGPRAIDIDILFYDDTVLHLPELTIPHALMQERAFVLDPLLPIAADWVHPVFQKTVAELRAELKDASGIFPTDLRLVIGT